MSQVVIDAFSSCYCHVVAVNICFLEFHGPVVASWWRAAQGLESWDRRGLGDLGSRRVNKHQKALGCLGSGCRNPHIWMSVYSLYYFCMLIIHWDHPFSWFRHRHGCLQSVPFFGCHGIIFPGHTLHTPVQRNHGGLVGNFHIPLGPCTVGV